MKIGRFYIEEVKDKFQLKFKQDVVDIFDTQKEALFAANTYERIYNIAYNHGYSDRNNEFIDSNKYHYM